MKKVIVIGVIALFIVVGFQPAFANDITIGIEKQQPFGGTFMKTYETITYDRSYYVQQTTDGGYIITGETETYDNPGIPLDIWLIKTDSNGNKMWDKTFGGYSDDRSWCVQQTSDGGYIITGQTYSYGAGNGDVWLIKTDSDGNKMWDKTFGGTSYDDGFYVQQTSDGGYIITGTKGGVTVWLIKTDSTGNTEWDKTFGGSKEDWGWCVQQTSDGGYIITGYTESFGAGENDIWLIKTDNAGNKEWDKTFGGESWDFGIFVQLTSDGGYIIIGNTYSYGAGSIDIWLIKTDNAGNKEWDKTFGGESAERGECVRQTTDGGYILAGDTIDLIKTDNTGNEMWRKQFKGVAFCVQQTSDGGYIITGDKQGDVWLIKTDSDGNMEWDKTFDRKNKAVSNNMLLLRILERFPLLQRLLDIYWWNIE